MALQLKDFPETKIAYIRVYGPWGSTNNEYVEAYGKLFAWAKTEKIEWKNEIMIYLMQTPEGKGPAADTSLVVPTDTVGNEEIKAQVIPAGLYAVKEYRGVAQAENMKSWSEVTELVGKMEGHEADYSRPFFELYREGCDFVNGIYNIDIYEAVKPK